MTQPTVSDTQVSTLPDLALRRRHEDDALDIVRKIRDAFAPKLHDVDDGGQVLVWLLDFAERVAKAEGQ